MTMARYIWLSTQTVLRLGLRNNACFLPGLNEYFIQFETLACLVAKPENLKTDILVGQVSKNSKLHKQL